MHQNGFLINHLIKEEHTMKKVVALILVLGLWFSPVGSVWAGEASPAFKATASALVPGVGQIMNRDHYTSLGKLKILTMWLLELGAIITTPILASRENWPVAMVGVGIFAVNHIWSSVDAYQVAVKQGTSLEGAKTR